MAAKKEKYIHPDHEAILKYQEEIAYWQERYDIANEKHDWDDRNLASCRLVQKRANLQRLITLVGQDKLKRWKINYQELRSLTGIDGSEQ